MRVAISTRHNLVPLTICAMDAVGGGKPVNPDEHVADLLQNLNLTVEGDVVAFSDDEDDGEVSVVEWILVGKVLSPAIVHSTTIFRAK